MCEGYWLGRLEMSVFQNDGFNVFRGGFKQVLLHIQDSSALCLGVRLRSAMRIAVVTWSFRLFAMCMFPPTSGPVLLRTASSTAM